MQEEIGLRGAKTSAFTIDPQVGIAVDVTHATDCPGIDQNQFGRVELGQGPVVFRGPNVNPVVFETLSGLSERKEIPMQVNGISRAASNDGNVMQTKPRRRGYGHHRDPQPLHAQPGRGRLPERPGKTRRSSSPSFV